ncbi:GpE family phage tail protein [Salmonella enterica]|nr:GpE family phage tail protein [Salmonella enterica]EJJ2875739.1 GpE family phage tail protein [Salmonella enterica]ELU6795715.1 GpE family phage tail protein [Salmonella enterica]
MARWFRWQPGEIDRLLMDEFEEYIDEANEQIKREYGD